MSEDGYEKMLWVCRDLIRKVIEQQYAESTSNIKGNKK